MKSQEVRCSLDSRNIWQEKLTLLKNRNILQMNEGHITIEIIVVTLTTHSDILGEDRLGELDRRGTTIVLSYGFSTVGISL